MDGVGSPASTALSVAREIPRRLAVSTVLRPWASRRRRNLSPNWRSKWSIIKAELLETSICSVYLATRVLIKQAEHGMTFRQIEYFAALKDVLPLPSEAGRSLK